MRDNVSTAEGIGMEAGEILIRRGLLDKRQLDLARAKVTEGATLLDSAVNLGLVDEEAALRAIADEVGLDFIDLESTDIDFSLLKNFPSKLIHRQCLFPVSRTNGHLTVATADPFDLYGIDEVSAATVLSGSAARGARVEISAVVVRL